MKSEAAQLFLYEVNARELHCPPLHWSSITENIGFKAEFTLSSSSVKVGFTDITISILEKSHSLLASFLRGFGSACEDRKASWVLLRNLSIF